MMFGYEVIAVLPILLILAAFAGLLAIVVTVYSEINSKSCTVCGVEFLGQKDLNEHMKSHDRALGSKKFVSKERFKKAA